MIGILWAVNVFTFRPYGVGRLRSCFDLICRNSLTTTLSYHHMQIRITDEFYLQGDLELSLGMDVTPMCDRAKQVILLPARRLASSSLHCTQSVCHFHWFLIFSIIA